MYSCNIDIVVVYNMSIVVLCKNISSQIAWRWPNSVAETCSYKYNKTPVKIVLVVLKLYTHILYIYDSMTSLWFFFFFFAYLNVEASFSKGPLDFLYLVSVFTVFSHIKFESLTKIVTEILYYKNLSGNLRRLPNMIWNLPVKSMFEISGWVHQLFLLFWRGWGGGGVLSISSKYIRARQLTDYINFGTKSRRYKRHIDFQSVFTAELWMLV
jgi:hypothetical protein